MVPNAIPKFSFNDHELRGTIIDGEPWFVVADVCRILGRTNPTMACRALDDDEKGLTQTETIRGLAPVRIVSRPGLFKLIQRSDKPQAKAFDRWVRHDVLPQIMDNGGYVTADANIEKVTAAAPGNTSHRHSPTEYGQGAGGSIPSRCKPLPLAPCD